MIYLDLYRLHNVIFHSDRKRTGRGSIFVDDGVYNLTQLHISITNVRKV